MRNEWRDTSNDNWKYYLVLYQQYKIRMAFTSKIL